MRQAVFPHREVEAQELYHQGQKHGGVMNRAVGESMLAYISRRRRWYKTLKELDPKTEISENIRADLLLMLSGINEDKQLLVRTSVGNVSDFEKIADALVRQHPRIHINERRSQEPKGHSGEWNGKTKK